MQICVLIFQGTWILAGVQYWGVPSTSSLGLTTAAVTRCWDQSRVLLPGLETHGCSHWNLVVIKYTSC